MAWTRPGSSTWAVWDGRWCARPPRSTSACAPQPSTSSWWPASPASCTPWPAPCRCWSAATGPTSARSPTPSGRRPRPCPILGWSRRRWPMPAGWRPWPATETSAAASCWSSSTIPRHQPTGHGAVPAGRAGRRAPGRRRSDPHPPGRRRRRPDPGRGGQPRAAAVAGRAGRSGGGHRWAAHMTRRRRHGQPWLRRRTGLVPAGLPGPDALEIGPRTLGSGGVLHQTLAVTGYPREVGPGWLQPLLDHPGPIDVAVHIEPVATVVAAERLRRQLARLESSQRLDATRGRLDDPQVEAAAHDAQLLARRLATGEGRLVRVGLYVTVRGHTQAELDAAVARVQGLLGSLLLAAHPTTFRALQGWITTLPLGLDQLGLQRTMDTAAVAACFPFASADLPPPPTGGVLVGRNLRTQGLVCWDRWAQPNYNQVILARSGAGKSYLAKLEALRWLYQGVQVLVVDPENEYQRLTAAVGGAYLRLGAPGVHLNPLDLGSEPDALTRRALFAHTLVAVLLGGPLDPAASAVVDRAVLAAYAAQGITSDPRTHPPPGPLLQDRPHSP